MFSWCKNKNFNAIPQGFRLSPDFIHNLISVINKDINKVISDDKIVEFHWGKTELRKAEIIAIRSFSFIRFRWQDDENERDYFEIKMTYNELTSDYVLEITDFAESDEVDDMKELWESQVAKLRRTCGF